MDVGIIAVSGVLVVSAPHNNEVNVWQVKAVNAAG
jgi:hypothetical protein